MIPDSSIARVKELGQLPISIGTSLAIEGAVGLHPDHPTGVDVFDNYPAVWINLRTLFRNLHGAIPKEFLERARPEQLAAELLAEMVILDEHFQEKEFTYYFSYYRDTERLYPNATRRMDSTEKQKRYTQLEAATIKKLFDHINKTGGMFRRERDVLAFDQKISPIKQSDTLIITHISYDLVNRKAFKELDLLESHTGIVKKYPEWYTKYLNGKELSMIPFREDFLQVFGDSWMFAPMKKDAREDIIELAKARRWTPVTTSEKIRYDIGSLKNHFLRETLREIMV